MPENLYLKLRNRTNWKFFLLLCFGFIICAVLFEFRKNAFGTLQALDPRWAYGPPEVVDLFNKLNAIGKLNLYLITEISLDVVFPFIYCAILGLLIVRLYSEKLTGYLLLLPIFAGLADLGENFTIAYLILTFDKQVSSIAYLASVLTSLKWFLAIASLLVVVWGAVVLLFRKITGKQ